MKRLIFITKPTVSFKPLCFYKFEQIIDKLPSSIEASMISCDQFDCNSIDQNALPVVWGTTYNERLNLKPPFLVLERGYVGNRTKFYSLGLNGLNGRADFRNQGSPADRWNQSFAKLVKPWNTSGDYILLLGQNPNDASLQHFKGTYAEIIEDIRRHSNRRILFKPHPNDRTKYKKLGVDVYRSPTKFKTAKTNALIGDNKELNRLIDGSSCTVSINSNASVIAVLRGKPSIVLDEGAMAWNVCQHSCEYVESNFTPTRDQWCYDLAYTQWTLDEIATDPSVLQRFQT